MEIERQCIKCKNVFTVNGLNIRQRLCKNDSGKSVQATYCKCEKCGSVNVLQLDDENTMNDMRKLTTLIGRRVRDRHKHSRDLASDKEMRDKLEKRIRERREKLIEQNKGSCLYERNGNLLVKGIDM